MYILVSVVLSVRIYSPRAGPTLPGAVVTGLRAAVFMLFGVLPTVSPKVYAWLRFLRP